jgi:hypothetical protein
MHAHYTQFAYSNQVAHGRSSPIRRAAPATAAVYPQRHLQGRLYTILPFLAEHGMGLVEFVC